MSTKKQSLFKQKLRLQKQISPFPLAPTSQTFPQSFKLNCFTHEQKIIPSQQIKTINQIKQIDNNTFLLTNNNRLNIKEDQIKQIDSQNWEAVRNMSQKERMDYQRMIEETLPKQFINKLKKKLNIVKQQPAIQKMQQQKQQISQVKQISQIRQTKNAEPQQPQAIQSHLQLLSHIYLHLATNKLTFIPSQAYLTFSAQQSSQYITFHDISQMTQSQNNQSQIVGSKMLVVWIKDMFLNKIVRKIMGVVVHLRVVLVGILKVVREIQQHIAKTRFKSCYIQMIASLCQILTILKDYLNRQQLQQQLLFIQKQFNKSKKTILTHQNTILSTNSQDIQRQIEQNNLLFDSLVILIQGLKSQIQLQKQKQIQKYDGIQIQQQLQKLTKPHILQQLIQAMLIQQTLFPTQLITFQIQPIIIKILKTTQSYYQYFLSNQLNNKNIQSFQKFYFFIYLLVGKLKIKIRNQTYYKSLIKNIYQGFFKVWEIDVLKGFVQRLATQHNSSNNSPQYKQTINRLLFVALFVYRQLLIFQGQKFAQFIQNSKVQQKASEQEKKIIIYINLDHYLQASDLTPWQLCLLQKTLTWLTCQLCNLTPHHLSPFLILQSLFSLFLSPYQQIYSLLDQSLLSNLLSVCIRRYQQEIQGSVLLEEEVKQLARNYNFNSFGNDVFTRIMVWVMVRYTQYAQLIANQVVTKYTMLFYYALEDQPYGNIEQYYHTEKKSSKYVSASKPISISSQLDESIRQQKVQLLKLLSLNLDFSEADPKIISMINKGSSTQGFIIKKQKLNPLNYFYRYLCHRLY